MAETIQSQVAQLAASAKTRVPITDLDVRRASTLNAPPGTPNSHLASIRSGGVNHIYGMLGLINQIFSELVGPDSGIMSWRSGMSGLVQPSQFPTPDEVFIGWTAQVAAAVTDNDPTRTNTGQSFTAGDLIVWGGSGWVIAATSGGAPPSVATNTTYTFPTALPSGTGFDTQTGAYPGGPASLDGPAQSLPATGGAFVSNGDIIVFVNGQQLVKGAGLGMQQAQWLSGTQLAFDFDLLPGNQVTLRST